MKMWLKGQIGRLARFAAREMADEFEKVRDKQRHGEQEHVTVDVRHLVNQLNSNEVKHLIIRFFERNHRWIANLAERNRRIAAATHDFVESHMPDALFHLDQFAVIESKRDEMYQLGGYILDLGVYKGGSTRRLARIFREETIHGFDSFEGLPEDWSYVLKGEFGDIAGKLPGMPDNVVLYKGWFEDTLPRWKAAHCERPISILRIDCDIYSSTKTVFDTLGDRLRPGSWLVFDELIGYKGWEKHEYKAFLEFIDESGFDYSYIAYGLTYVIVRLGEESLPSRVAVVVPVFNGGAHLTDCLESVARQSWKAWRCYVVDDASSDETSGIAEAFAARDRRFTVLRHGCHAGLAAARNTGLAHAEEPLVMFLDGDDMLTPSSLRRRVEVMRHCWSDEAVVGAWETTRTVGQDASLADAVAFGKDSPGPPAVHAPLCRAELLRRLGGFDERLRQDSEEQGLWQRLLRHGYRFEHVGGTVAGDIAATAARLPS